MSKRKSRTQSRSQRILWFLSLFIAGSMIVSLVIVALPSGPRQTPTPPPTWTLQPTATPMPTPTPLPFPTFAPTEPPAGPLPPTGSPDVTNTPLPTVEETAPPAGPELPTEAPAGTITATITPSPTLEATEPPMGPVLPTVSPTATLTPSTSSLEFTFAVCGDSRDNPQVYRRLLDAVQTDGSDFLLHTGDLVNRGTESQWLELKETMAGFTLPFYPVAGNHDSLNGDLDGYLEYSGAPAAHYSFDRDPIHFVLADSHNGGISAVELNWLRDDLRATNQPIKMVFLHHPPFDPDGTDHIMAYGNEKFMALMAEQAVDHVFAGHIHAYAQEERDGVVYTITGGAGAPLYGQDHPQAFHHYLRVTVRGEEVSIEVVKI